MPTDAQGRWGARCAAALLATLAVGCLKNVPQDEHSGKDHRSKGAREIKLEDGDGQSKRDIVTYPGGDRVDWKFFKTPEGPGGILKIRLKWRPPRRGLDLSFRVYDEYFGRIARARPAAGSGRRSKTVTIKNARGGMKYYVQVYAPRRMDAGEYLLQVRYRGRRGMAAAGPADIPDPPRLPAIPETEPTEETTPQPCPNDPTKMQPDCPPEETEPAAEPVTARVVKYQVSSSGAVIITVDRGKTSGIEAGWVGQVVGSTGRPAEGGSFTVTKVTSGESVGKVRMSVDQIKANRKVILSPSK